MFCRIMETLISRLLIVESSLSNSSGKATFAKLVHHAMHMNGKPAAVFMVGKIKQLLKELRTSCL